MGQLIHSLYDEYLKALKIYHENRFSGTFEQYDKLAGAGMQLAMALDTKGFLINDSTVIVADLNGDAEFYIRVIELLKSN